jgi:hypothetical protein
MKHIKSFNENAEWEDENISLYNPTIRIKDIIEYLSKLDPEMKVDLDKDGWNPMGKELNSPNEYIENSGLFDVWDDEGRQYMTINN